MITVLKGIAAALLIAGMLLSALYWKWALKSRRTIDAVTTEKHDEITAGNASRGAIGVVLAIGAVAPVDVERAEAEGGGGGGL